MSIAWEASERALEVFKIKFCKIHETPDKEKTPEQFEELKTLRKECVAIGDLRYEMVRKSKYD